MRSLARAFVVAGLCFASGACAQVDGGGRTASADAHAARVDVAEVRRMLQEDAREEAWLAVGDAAVSPLVQAAHSAMPLAQRRAAVRALGVLATSEATEAIRAVLVDPRAPEPLRVEATEALARAGGQTALAQLLPLITRGSPALCAAAAEAVARLGGDEVRDALETRLEHETDPELRARLQRSLTRLHP